MQRSWLKGTANISASQCTECIHILVIKRHNNPENIPLVTSVLQRQLACSGRIVEHRKASRS